MVILRILEAWRLNSSILGGSSQDLDTWLITMVSFRPLSGVVKTKWPKWLINEGY